METESRVDFIVNDFILKRMERVKEEVLRNVCVCVSMCVWGPVVSQGDIVFEYLNRTRH